jgi:hypothetical protein
MMNGDDVGRQGQAAGDGGLTVDTGVGEQGVEELCVFSL